MDAITVAGEIPIFPLRIISASGYKYLCEPTSSHFRWPPEGGKSVIPGRILLADDGRLAGLGCPNTREPAPARVWAFSVLAALAPLWRAGCVVPAGRIGDPGRGLLPARLSQ